MITKKEEYKPTNNYLFLDQKRKMISKMRKQIAELGIDPGELGVFARDRDRINYEKRVSENQSVSLR